jgi:hypothetical protein
MFENQVIKLMSMKPIPRQMLSTTIVEQIGLLQKTATNLVSLVKTVNVPKANIVGQEFSNVNSHHPNHLLSLHQPLLVPFITIAA